MSGVAAILLAAGQSSRLGSPKALLCDATGVPLVRRMAAVLQAGGCATVVVVTGASADAVRAACEGTAEAMPADARLPAGTLQYAHNPDYRLGMAGSIATGVRTAIATGATAMLVATCDMPALDAAHIRDLISASAGGSWRVATEHEAGVDRPAFVGVPAVFPARDGAALLALSGDRGARDLLRQPDTLSVLFRGPQIDLDTPADVARWRASWPTASAAASTATHLLPALPMASSLFATAFGDLDAEFAQTRRMLERVPAEHLDFTPHPKSWPLKKLARHLCDFPEWALVTLTTTELDFDVPMPPKAIPTDAAGFLAAWDAGVAALTAHLPAVTDADLAVEWRALAGGHAVIKGSRAEIMRGMVINHMIHHRAQLSIYYRLVGVPLPGLYGPSADEQ